MLRQHVYELIDRERDYQDKYYPKDQVLSSGLTREMRDKDVSTHLVMSDIYLARAKQVWMLSGDGVTVLQELVKLAAIVVRALEMAGNSAALHTIGVRPNY